MNGGESNYRAALGGAVVYWQVRRLPGLPGNNSVFAVDFILDGLI